jgi:glucan phosphoethanolaminetransferase (alkaline phosphatase superfamily)
MISAVSMLPFRHADVTSPGIERARQSPDARAKRWHARRRRWASRAALLLPGLLVVGCDVALQRGAPLRGGPALARAYLEAAAFGVLLWGGLLLAASGRRGAWRLGARLSLLTLAFVAVGGQLYSFGRYRAFLGTSSMLVGTSMLPSVRQQLWFDSWSFLRAVVPPVVAIAVLMLLQRRLAPPRRWSPRLGADVAAIFLCVIALFAPRVDDREVGPFDTLYVNAMGQLARAVWDKNPCLARAHPGTRFPIPVPPLAAKPARPRNVLFVLTESVRAQSSCVKYEPDCRITPFSNAAAKGRIPLTQMRAVDSTTAISLGVMWSGISPTASRDALHSAPLVWEYANAAGVDTAYWTSQHLLFGNSGAWLQGIAWGHHVSATELEDDPDLETGADDGTLVSYVNAHLGEMREPYLAVVHLSNTHMPYAIDDSDAPFQPQGPENWRGHEVEISNRYHDAMYHQDRAIGRLIEATRARPESARTIIVFLSDHGEQLYEKGAFGHTGTLFETEIRIPAWIDAPPGTLSPEEERQLRSLEETPLTTMDVLPTLLDLVGVMDDPAIKPLASRFLGKSLLRGGSPPSTPVVMTNCTELWACAFRNWGAIQGTKKLIGMQGGGRWSCFDVKDDPTEQLDRGPEECSSLIALTEAQNHGRPF